MRRGGGEGEEEERIYEHLAWHSDSFLILVLRKQRQANIQV